MNDTIREIHTGFYSDRAEQIIGLLLRDEQNQQQALKRTFKVKSMIYLGIKRAIDNEVVFTCERFHGWYSAKQCFAGISDADALTHIAWCFKQCVLRCLKGILLDEDKAKENWSRSNGLNFKTELSESCISVSEAYFIYDILRQRKNAAKRYSKEMSDSLIGRPLDPIMTEMKIGMLEEIEKIKEEQERTIQKLYKEESEAIAKCRKEIAERYQKSKKELENEAAAKIAQIKAEMKAMMTHAA